MTAYRFDEWVLDAERFELRRGAELVSVEPKVFDMLHYLVANTGRVATKLELIERLWGDSFISESALTTCVAAARQAVGDNGRKQQIIRTVHGRGYELVATVAVESPPDGEEEAPPAAAPRPRHRPVPAKPLIGRADAIDDIVGRLAPGRLVTVVGPAGVGKTHLANHVADSHLPGPEAGFRMVELAPVRSADAVAQHVLDALDTPPGQAATVTESVIAALDDFGGVLVLDNCEHVHAAVADLLTAVLDAKAKVSVLTTSRRRLGVAGEQIVDLQPLDPGSSVDLLTARAADHGVDLGTGTPAVAELCRMLDHLPLALELAAARIRVLGVHALSELLDDRLRLLEADGSAADHHRSLEFAIASSYDALDPPLQQSLCHLSQFAGSFDLRAGALIAKVDRDIDEVEAVRHIIELAERSLLIVDDRRDRTRYRLLESIRLFAAERLESPAVVRAAHLQFFTDLAQRRHERCNTPAFEPAWAEFAVDWANYRVAIEFGLEQALVDDVLTLVAATADNAYRAQRFEHCLWAEQALALGGSSHPTAPEVMAGLAALRSVQDRIDEVVELAEAAGEPSRSVRVANAKFLANWSRGRHAEASEMLALVDELARDSGGLDELAALSWRHVLATFAGAELGDADRRTRAIAGNGPVGRVFLLNAAIGQALRAGEWERAVELSQETAEASAACGLEAYRSAALLKRSYALNSVQPSPEAAHQVLAGMTYQRSIGYWTALRPDAGMAAKLLFETGSHETAAVILGGCEQLSYRGHGSDTIDDVTAAAKAALGDRFEALFAQGAELSVAQLSDYVTEQLARLLDAGLLDAPQSES